MRSPSFADSSASAASVPCSNTNVASAFMRSWPLTPISLLFSLVQVLKLTPKGAYPRLTHLPIPQIATVLYHESPIQPSNAEMRMVLCQKMGESINGSELAHTVSGAVNGEVVSHVLLDEVSKPGLGDTRKIQVVRSASHVDLQAHFVQIPDLFLHLRPVVVGVSHDPI